MKQLLNSHSTQQIRNLSLVMLGIVVGLNIGSRYIDAWFDQTLTSDLSYQHTATLLKVGHKDPVIETCFTPQEKCAPKVISHIQQAKSSIALRMFAFTSKEIADALIEAHQRGIHILMLCDREQARQQHSQVSRLQAAGIQVTHESVRGYAHNKVMIIDHRIVFTGSYNYTAGAENRNAENLLMIKGADIVQRYLQDFELAQTTAIKRAYVRQQKAR